MDAWIQSAFILTAGAVLDVFAPFRKVSIRAWSLANWACALANSFAVSAGRFLTDRR
jgi:hypothetical protein